jgi:hypothetical protein
MLNTLYYNGLLSKKETFKILAKALLKLPFSLDVWEEIFESAIQLLRLLYVFIARLVMFILFPISLPVLFFIARRKQHKVWKAQKLVP